MIKYIKESELNEINIEPGMVVQVQDGSDLSIHDILIAISGGKLVGVCIADECTKLSSSTGDNYCELNNALFPNTCGIDTIFGSYVTAIYPHLGLCDDEEVIFIVTYIDDGRALIKFKC